MQPTVSRFRRAALAVKIETAYATDVLPVAADIVEIRNVVYVSPHEATRDERISGLGIDLPDIPGSRAATIAGELLLRGAGAVYSASVKPEADAILRALGFTATGTFTGGSESWDYKRATGATFGESVTAKLYTENGPQGVLLGAFGSGRILHRRGQPSVLAFALTGLYVKPGDVALVTATPSTVQPPVFHAANVTIDAVAHDVESVDVDLGNDVQLIPGANASHGYRGVHLAGRRPMISLDPEAVPVATFDWFVKRDNGTLLAGNWQTGAVQYNRIIETVAKLQVLDITEGQRNGLRIHNITGKLNVGTIASDKSNEYILNFS